jgi:DNA-binding MarR family transcriptional regulator
MVHENLVNEIAENCLLMRTRLISRVVTGIYDEELRPLGIKSPQLVLLVVISKIEPATRAEIGRYHHQDRSTLTRNLKVMLSEGWVEEIQGEVRGRSRPIVLTKAGKDLLRNSAPAWRVAQAQTKALLGKNGVIAVRDLADRIMNPRPTA